MERNYNRKMFKDIFLDFHTSAFSGNRSENKEIRTQEKNTISIVI